MASSMKKSLWGPISQETEAYISNRCSLLTQLGVVELGLDAGLAVSTSAGSRLSSLTWKLHDGFICPLPPSLLFVVLGISHARQVLYQLSHTHRCIFWPFLRQRQDGAGNASVSVMLVLFSERKQAKPFVHGLSHTPQPANGHC